MLLLNQCYHKDASEDHKYTCHRTTNAVPFEEIVCDPVMYALLALREEHAPVPKFPSASNATDVANLSSASASPASSDTTSGSSSPVKRGTPQALATTAASAPASAPTDPRIRRSARIKARKQALPFVPDASPVSPGSHYLSNDDSDIDELEMDIRLNRTIVSEYRKKMAQEKAARDAAELKKKREYAACLLISI